MFEPRLWESLQRRRAPGENHPVQDFVVVQVDERARSLAPTVPLPNDLALPPQAPLEEQERLLAGVQGGGRIAGLEWPVCCDRLAVLHFHQGTGETLLPALEAGVLDACILSGGQLAADDERATWRETLDLFRRHRHGGDGLALLRCAACARVYGAWVIP
jgi:hypothetical protein